MTLSLLFRAARFACVTFAGLGVLVSPAHAVDCGVGDQVQGDMGGGAKGTIAEIGTQPPHVGWYRIVFEWNKPRGDWYQPSQWEVRPVGSDSRCGVGAPTRAAPMQDNAAPVRKPPAPIRDQPPPATPDPRLPSTERCRSGARVVDRQERAGVVLGENNGSCLVRLDDGSSKNYLAWMLSPEGAASAPVQGLAPGRYTCSADGAGQFAITIAGGGSYSDRAGKPGRYRLDAATGNISFDSGSLAGQHSKLLGPGKFGLSSAPTKMYYAVCNLKR